MQDVARWSDSLCEAVFRVLGLWAGGYSSSGVESLPARLLLVAWALTLAVLFAFYVAWLALLFFSGVQRSVLPVPLGPGSRVAGGRSTDAVVQKLAGMGMTASLLDLDQPQQVGRGGAGGLTASLLVLDQPQQVGRGGGAWPPCC